MKFRNILILIFIIILLNSCQKNKNIADNNNEIKQNNLKQYAPDSNLLTKKFRYNYISRTISVERAKRYSVSQDLFFNALRAFQEKDIYLALEHIESAIKVCPESAYYYHYGSFLMDINDYENAEKLFM